MFLRKRDAYQHSVLAICQSPLDTDDFSSQAQLLCEACIAESNAQGCTLYLQPGAEETGFRRAARAGFPAEETGPGLVKDLLNQAWETGEIAESRSGKRWILAFPVWSGHSGGGAMLVIWETVACPGEVERQLMQTGAIVASLLAPRFVREGALVKAHEEIQALKGEVAEESHLAGVGRLATGVAHELSTPLSAVLTMVQSLSRTIQDPVGARRLKIIQDAVEKCKGIIEKLLVYSKAPFEEEQSVTFSRFVRASTDINQIIDNTLEIKRDLLAEGNIVVETDLDSIPEIRANSSQWSQLFNNMLDYELGTFAANKTAHPKLSIRTRDEEHRIRIEISDNSPAIAPEEQDRVFEPFYASHSEGLGSGLCLTAVREVVRKHKGTVQVKSKPSEGNTFVFKIPLEEPEQKA